MLMVTNNTNVPAAKVSSNAKGKAPSKAQRMRNNVVKANALAAKRLPDMDQAALITALVDSTKRADGAARTFAHWMNNQFADAMRDHKCHWSAFTPANCRSDNEKALLARINDIKRSVSETALNRGLANINKPWSDMKRIAVELYTGGVPRERQPKPLETLQVTLLTKAYKAAMKEERQTPEEADCNFAIGELLRRFFKVDLSKLG